MKTKTEKILMVMKVLAFCGGIGYSIECGSELLSFVASFINLNWAKHVANVNPDIYTLRDHNLVYYVFTMCLVIVISAMKAFVWWEITDLLLKLKINTPFSMEVTKKLERIAYVLLGIWIIGLIGKLLINWLTKSVGIFITGTIVADEYIFVAGIVYIVSQIFKRGIELQEENQLTV